ncbi:transposase [Streptomyces pratensis]|uniref:transposase n=1 Tax=Streptomyces pratensis TaxID=1169025 RepID=UPI0037873B6C
MGRKSPYPAEFRNDAVALCRAAGGKRTYAAVAADVAVPGETLRSWVRQADEYPGRAHSHGEQSAESPDQELARLRAGNGRLRKAEKEGELEREILRRAGQGRARRISPRR